MRNYVFFCSIQNTAVEKIGLFSIFISSGCSYSLRYENMLVASSLLKDFLLSFTVCDTSTVLNCNKVYPSGSSDTILVDCLPFDFNSLLLTLISPFPCFGFTTDLDPLS